MMKSSVSDRSLYIESEEEDEVNEEEVGNKIPPDDESDGSDSSSVASPRRSRPSSYNTTWPQSYRQSIDMYSSVTPPTIGFLGTPTLSRLGSSFITSSFQGKHTPEIISSLIKPLLPTRVDEQEQQKRQSSHSLLLPPPIPSRRPSLRKPKDDTKLSKVSHELPISRNCSFGQAVINGINVLCGVGILSTPYAVKVGGWAGLSILFIFAGLSYYTGILLKHCLDSEPGLETYPDIGQAAFGTKGRFLVSIILYLELYACCVEYIILESDNLSSLFPNAHLTIGSMHISSHVLFAVMTTLIVLPTTWLRDLSLLSYISAGGVIASILVVASLFWVGLIDQVGFQNKGDSLNLTGIPIAIGLYGYCYSGHAVYPNIYSSLEKKNQFPLVLFTCFVICTVMFAGVAVIGYLMFGETTLSQFTLNMPQGLVASKLAVWTTVVNPITKYALTLTPMALSFEELIPANHMKSHLYPIAVRSTLAFSTLFVALSVPFFGLVMAFIGSLLTMFVTLILPCACFMSIVKGKLTWLEGIFCIFIIIVGVICAGFGTTSAISKIIESY
ncbi:amino acid transporter AVT1C [Dioscorea cayenensis subsp. rotundata]|uniref:Amino acid transporter AVT1C n=1 Tax=Dioscorea cayennensis subsp. rotundata TaxID=55577 RepID=A0AB40CMT5_DIOCR|nr:amino acid transporter AVT1C [Dioscorea cayenensis subsp. rotundata]XP_039140389.1 amino acid transporter AVT1C [Dioscorea cayenensis subsp. rotundata]